MIVLVLCLAVLAFWFGFQWANRARAAVSTFASPIQGGCYIAGPNDCRLHVDPFSVNLNTGSKLVYFQLVTIQQGTGIQTMIWDFRPDQSNPVPFTGDVVNPSLPALDFAATCGKSYQISLQGRDSIDSNAYNLGTTNWISCPVRVP